MTSEHSSVENYTVTEHEMECRKSRLVALQQLRQPEVVESSDEKADCDMEPDEEEDDGEENEVEEEEEEDGEEEEEEEENEEEGESEEECEEDEANAFPISVSIRQRRNILREAGCQVDLTEREDCQFIRLSREGISCWVDLSIFFYFFRIFNFFNFFFKILFQIFF